MALRESMGGMMTCVVSFGGIRIGLARSDSEQKATETFLRVG